MNKGGERTEHFALEIVKREKAEMKMRKILITAYL